MKKKILAQLAKIQKVAELTGMSGKISIEFSGVSVADWDRAVESITEYPRMNHFVSITDKLTVALLLG